jgi:hypothetical protein
MTFPHGKEVLWCFYIKELSVEKRASKAEISYGIEVDDRIDFPHHMSLGSLVDVYRIL